jgi:hypothetical protein
MKSKKFILNQIKEIVDAKGKDGDAFVATLGEKNSVRIVSGEKRRRGRRGPPGRAPTPLV